MDVIKYLFWFIQLLLQLTVYMDNDNKKQLDMNKIYRRGSYDFHRCMRKKNRLITNVNAENQDPNLQSNNHIQMLTFGNWKNNIQINKYMQKSIHQIQKASIKQTIQLPKQENKKISSSRQCRHKPLFPKNNQIIKRFFKIDNEPTRYRTLDRSQNNSHNTSCRQGSVEKQRKTIKSLRNSKQMIKEQFYHKLTVSPSYSRQVRLNNNDDIAPNDAFVQIPKFNKNSKKWFTNIYNRQKANYEGLLQRYGIKEKVDDSEFVQFLHRIQ